METIRFSQRWAFCFFYCSCLLSYISLIELPIVGSIAAKVSTVPTAASVEVDVEGECPDDPTKFLCDNGRCVLHTWVCDKDDDCGDGSDESNETCGKPQRCHKQEFYCPIANRCIPNRWVCDGEPDCGGDGSIPDQSDETGCVGKNCSATEYQCGTNHSATPPYVPLKPSTDPATLVCISRDWMCDGSPDCPDGSDESGCAKNVTSFCGEHEWPCALGLRCILDTWKCDGDEDCPDGSDEKDCPAMQCDPALFFNCTESPPDYRRQCISLDWVCDGDADCLFGEDERNCSGDKVKVYGRPHECKTHEAKCDSGQCIHSSWVCDGEFDCLDRSDEAPDRCKGVSRTSCHPLNEFSCLDFHANRSECILATKVCDSVVDCLDGSDEANCTDPTAPCNDTVEFTCRSDGKCINHNTSVCNGVKDCADGSDEEQLKCGEKQCDFTTNAGCGQNELCFKNPVNGSNYCDCKHGYAMALNGSCLDIDECAQHRYCTQKCTNTQGGYICGCHRHYLLQQDGKHCRAIGDHPRLLLSNRVNIRQIDLQSLRYTPLVSHLESAVAIDVDVSKRLLFWSDVAKEQIFMTKLEEDYQSMSISDGKHKAVVLAEEGIDTPDGLAIDWVHDLLYWTDTGLDSISVMRVPIDGYTSPWRKVLFDTDLDEPRAIALDPDLGVMFWTDWGEKPKIEFAGMDGSARSAIIDKGITWPNGLTLDILEKRIYWVDAQERKISMARYDGSDRRVVYSNPLHVRHPFGIAVFEERVYWTDWNTKQVQSANKFTGEGEIVVAKGLVGPMNIRIVQNQSQPMDIDDKCARHICAHLCLPRPRISNRVAAEHFFAPYACHCSTNFTSINGGVHCQAEGQTDGGDVEEKQTGRIAAAVIAILCTIAVCVSLVGWWFYKNIMQAPGRSFNFDNPVYRKTTQSADDPDPLDFDAPIVGFATAGHLSFNSVTEPLTRPYRDDA